MSAARFLQSRLNDKETRHGKDDSRPGRRAGDGKGRRHAGLRRARAPRSTRSTRRCASRAAIAHILARHVEGASHMAEGYTRAVAGNIGVCIGTSGPAGTDMITGLYSAQADSIPILCITGQAPRARLYKEDFQAVDIESISKPVTKWAVTVREPAQVPRAFQQAFHLMRSGRPGPGADRPAVRRADGRDRVRHRHLRAAAGLQAGRHPRADREGAGHAAARPSAR